jgi:uncharacterized protein YoxC
MSSINIVAIILVVGAGLILIGIVRGGIQTSSLKIPAISASASIVAVIVGTSMIILAVYLSITYQSFLLTSPLPQSSSSQTQALNDINSQLTDINGRLENVETVLSDIEKKPDQSSLGLEVSQIKVSVTDIQDKVNSLENIILDDPNKAVAIPLLQKDMENMKSLSDSQIQSLQQSVNQLYALLIGVVVVIGVGFLGIAASNLWGAKKP